MTQARSTVLLPGQEGLYHCVARCVRQAWLCGRDPETGKDYEHRKAKVEARILQLGSIFAVSVYSYAVMSNHLHVVVSLEPAVAMNWTDEEIVDRWLLLYPAKEPEQMALKRERLLGSAEVVAMCRARLADLSWFMRCLDEYIARMANAEDGRKGRFWEGEGVRSWRHCRLRARTPRAGMPAAGPVAKRRMRVA